jgi:hypothetical protein
MLDISCLVSPIPGHAFFEQAQLEGLLGDDLFQLLGLALEVFDLAAGRRPCHVRSEPAFASFQKLLRPAVVQAFGDTFAAAELGDGDFAAQTVEDDADLLLGRILFAGGPADLTSSSDGVSGVLDFCRLPTVQRVTMSPKSSIPQAANSISQVLMSDTPSRDQRAFSTSKIPFQTIDPSLQSHFANTVCGRGCVHWLGGAYTLAALIGC